MVNSWIFFEPILGADHQSIVIGIFVKEIQRISDGQKCGVGCGPF
jgi:hypothetical protein